MLSFGEENQTLNLTFRVFIFKAAIEPLIKIIKVMLSNGGLLW